MVQNCAIFPLSFRKKKWYTVEYKNVVKTKVKKYYEIPDIVLQKFMR